MIICIDSCVFIQGILHSNPTIETLFYNIIPKTTLFVPRVIVREVTRNLIKNIHIRQFYTLFQNSTTALIIDEPIPSELVSKYIQMGLNQKGDAIIGAFAEWKHVDYLLSNNRHFLRVLQPDAFKVMDTTTFVKYWNKNLD